MLCWKWDHLWDKILLWGTEWDWDAELINQYVYRDRFLDFEYTQGSSILFQKYFVSVKSAMCIKWPREWGERILFMQEMKVLIAYLLRPWAIPPSFHENKSSTQRHLTPQPSIVGKSGKVEPSAHFLLEIRMWDLDTGQFNFPYTYNSTYKFENAETCILPFLCKKRMKKKTGKLKKEKNNISLVFENFPYNYSFIPHRLGWFHYNLS